MPSITSWMRLEPRSRDAEMNTSLQARVYDPLWLLARQWQFGEFEGEDNGSPVIARWRGESARLTRYHSGVASGAQVNASAYDGRSLPLETAVEREPILSTNQGATTERLRLAAEAGQQFLLMLGRLLDEQVVSSDYREAFIRQYPFHALTTDERDTLDRDSLHFFDLIASRVPDGRRLYADFRSPGVAGIVLAPALNIAHGDLAEVRETARLWVQWFETFFSEPEKGNPSWLPERMEYSFSVGTRFGDGERVLTAPEYFEGHLDWYAFDANADLKLGAATDVSKEVMCTAIPSPVSFRGMPAARFWEFEDAQVDFGSVDAGPTDLLRLLLVEFALTYGNDWFVIPVELEVGSLHQTRSLVITDTFGVRSLIKSASQLGEPISSWRMFQHSSSTGAGQPASNLFFLPPSLLKSLESRPIEEVLFLRDEMANMAWAVERVVESASEYPLSRYQPQRPAAPPTEQAAANKLVYKLTTEVPDNWVPLMPVKNSAGLRLQRAKVLRTDGRSQFIEAQGRILNPDVPSQKDLKIFEEEIPREGVRVTRHYQLARWHDGSTHLWIARRKRVGGGEGSSGLRFDLLESK
ncbi:MAG: uncharacterized protein JWM21_2232 [Acidobacteria bacterium]|nr:uncharacterized protein [Acidobacteriota bacterium]